MSEEVTRGGMCNNPFGGRTRLDRLDLLQFLESDADSEKVLYLATIQDAAHNYLFYGLGRNGTTVEEFAASTQYFFHIRSNQPETWEHGRFLRTNAADEDGKRRTRVQKLTDSQLRCMCFDVHYEFSGLKRLLPMDRFLGWLKKERCKILTENWDQVIEYIDSARGRRERKLPEGVQLPLQVWAPTVRQTLTEPSGPKEIAEMLYVQPAVSDEPKPVRRRRARQRATNLLKLGVFGADPGNDGGSSIPNADS